MTPFPSRRALLTAGAALVTRPLAVWAAQEKPPPAPFTSPADVYSGISGPGEAVVGDGSGGYRSGYEGLMYKGGKPAKKGWFTAEWGNRATGYAVKDGLLPPIRPLWDLHLRDTVITVGGDGRYYMTGSSGDNIWDRNDGIELWRSDDLKAWDYLGLVWSFDKDGTWQKAWGKRRNTTMRAVWAPELCYVKKNYYLTFSLASGAGTGLLKSTTGKPEGPYVTANRPDARLTGGIDATLFEDGDKVYFTWGRGGSIALMKDDMSGFDGEPKKVKFEKPADGSWTRDEVAQEGASLFKRDGKYYLGGAAFYKGRYSSVVAIADHVYGPYKQWHEAVPCGGGTNYFRDKSGGWWCCYFGNDDQSPWREKPGAVRVEFAADGKIVVAKNQPFAPPK
ncbi:family 43 glycosylhydrolase [Limnoglobus roseus]|uniref:Inverting glycoside hydrolase n=1 Tax=Limnoglobus roseus TaxID=2598579 RepID=A0A5C1A8X0_9BACT|nr:family 43 glycosylhydrolase [Limnoglobus roseus]QEL14975.1 inverting glycoside hydrolase [Limnoglobus roseus]